MRLHGFEVGDVGPMERWERAMEEVKLVLCEGVAMYVSALQVIEVKKRQARGESSNKSSRVIEIKRGKPEASPQTRRCDGRRALRLEVCVVCVRVVESSTRYISY
jgi:hypothetical protein